MRVSTAVAGGLLLTVLSVGLPVLAADNDGGQQQHHCKWYDVCGYSDRYKLLNCPYDGPAIPLTDEVDAQDRLLELCPDIYKSRKCANRCH